MGTHRNAPVAQRVMVVVGDLDYLIRRLEQFATGDNQARETLLSESRELHGLAAYLHTLSVEIVPGELRNEPNSASHGELPSL